MLAFLLNVRFRKDRGGAWCGIKSDGSDTPGSGSQQRNGTQSNTPQARATRRRQRPRSAALAAHNHARAAGNHGSRTSARRGLSLPIFRAGPRLRNALAPTEHAELAPADKPAGPGPPWAVPLAKPSLSASTEVDSGVDAQLPLRNLIAAGCKTL